MKNVSIGLATMVLAMAFALSACGDGGDDAVSKYTKLVGEMCKCKDAACAEEVVKKSHAMKTSKRKPSRARMKKLAPLLKKYTKCLLAAKGVGKGVGKGKPSRTPIPSPSSPK